MVRFTHPQLDTYTLCPVTSETQLETPFKTIGDLLGGGAWPAAVQCRFHSYYYYYYYYYHHNYYDHDAFMLASLSRALCGIGTAGKRSGSM